MDYIKYILHLPAKATNSAARGELGLFPIYLFWKERILKYWYRANTQKLPYFLEQAFRVQTEMLEDGKNCWLLRTKEIYDTAGLQMKFYTCGNENSRTHINEVMTQLSDQFIQEWSSHLNGGDKTTGNKLRTYKLFKNQFQLEYYLVCQLPTKHQIALTKFRVSCHNLAIETGRYHKPSSLPVEQRLCPTCKEIEDEIHLLCQCRRNAGLRRNLFRTVTQYHTQFEMLDPVEKTIFLMQLKDEHIIRELAAFIFNSLHF